VKLDDIVATLSQAAQEGKPVSIRSTPAQAQGANVVIDTSSLSSLRLNSQAGVVSAGAGAEVTALNAEVDRAGYRVLGMPKNAQATHVGSLIATGEISRRALCGIRALLTSGEEVRAGGEIQKDVTGYDLCGYFLGSMGRSGVIIEATFRLAHKDVELPVGPGRGEAAVTVGPNLGKAFDPDGVLARG
jgi:FAD/FMN-containing dehydrogenase